MWSITLQLMRKAKRMLIPAGIAIMIGTAFIASTFLFANAMNDSLSRQMTAVFGGANYVAIPDTEGLSESETSRVQSTTAADFHLDRMARIAGVNGVRADVQIDVIVSTGDANGSGMAISTAANKTMLPVDITQGDRPLDAHEVALPETMAERLHIAIGDTVSLSSGYASDGDGKTTVDDVRVVGLTDDPNGAYSYWDGAIVASDDLIAGLEGLDDFDKVGVAAIYLDLAKDGDTVSAQTLDDALRLLPEHYGLTSRQSISEESVKTLSDTGVSPYTTFLLTFGVLAMLVAALVIANTFQVLVAQRRRTLALLRTIGAGTRQLYGSVLFEAAMLGLIASASGVALGTALMAGMCASNIMHMHMRLLFSWQVVAVPMAFGVITTVLAALSSARAATTVTPLEALRPIELTDAHRSPRVRLALAGLLMAAGLALAACAVLQVRASLTGDAGSMASSDGYLTMLLMAVAGAGLIFLAIIATARYWVPKLTKGVGVVVALAGPSSKVAHANIQKNPRRIAATSVALLIGVTLVATIATGAVSAKQTVNNALDARYSVDIVAIGEDLTQPMANEVSRVRGVDDVMYAPAASVRLQGADDGAAASVLLIGVKRIDDLRHVMHADLTGIAIGPDTVLMPRYNAVTGKRLTFDAGKATFDTNRNDSGEASFGLTVEQSDYRRVSSQYGAVGFVDARHFTNGDLQATVHTLLVKADDTAASIESIASGVQSALSTSADTSVTGPIAERVQWAQMVDSVMLLMVGLIAVAVLVALIGVANTLSLSVIERTRESATLRAIGMTRGQLKRSLAIEALLIAMVAGVAGVALGTLFGWLGSYVVLSEYGHVIFSFGWAVNGALLAVAALAALLASVLPARRAVNTPPVEALAEA